MKILKFIKNHPIITIWIITIILYFINAIKYGNPNPAGFFLIGLFLTAAFAPLIRRLRRKKERKEEMDYLAKKIAEEQNKK